MRMTWCDLLFAHWPVAPSALRGHVPPGLDLDTHDGSAWLGIVPFTMRDVRLRCVPMSFGFEELNVRTYVTRGGKPGVWFLSLDAASRLAVEGARLWFSLPYFKARMRSTASGSGVGYESRRTDRRGRPCELAARYRPAGAVFEARPGTLEHFLTARYCLYARDRGGVIRRGEIDHAPWPLQPAEAEIERNEYALAHGIELPATAPLLHFAKELATLAWPLT